MHEREREFSHIEFRNDVLQKPRNYFLINLAITDLGLLLTNNSMHVISSFKRQWIFGQAGRKYRRDLTTS